MDHRTIAPWDAPIGHPDTSLHAPTLDLADIAALRVRLDEVARLIHQPGMPAEKRDTVTDWPNRDLTRTVAHRCPHSRAVLLRTTLDGVDDTDRTTVIYRVTGSSSVNAFGLKEPALATRENVPSHDGDHAAAARWIDHLVALAAELHARVARHGRRAGDPYHEIGQTIQGSLETRIRQMHADAGATTQTGLHGRITAPSPYAPLDVSIIHVLGSSEKKLLRLADPIARAWSTGLGSTIDVSVGERMGSPSISLSPVRSIRFDLTEKDGAIDAMRAINAFPDGDGRPFVIVAPER